MVISVGYHLHTSEIRVYSLLVISVGYHLNTPENGVQAHGYQRMISVKYPRKILPYPTAGESMMFCHNIILTCVKTCICIGL